MGKLFFSVLLQFFTGRKINSAINIQGRLVKAVAETLKKEASELILKTSIGLVATGLLLYSLIVLGNYFHDFLLKYQYGTLFSVLFFIALSGGSAYLLFKLFYPKKEADTYATFFAKTKEGGFHFEKIYNTFLDGLSEGLSQAESSQRKIKVKKSEEEKFGEFPPSEMTH